MRDIYVARHGFRESMTDVTGAVCRDAECPVRSINNLVSSLWPELKQAGLSVRWEFFEPRV